MIGKGENILCVCFSTEPTIVCHFCRKKYKGLEEPRTIKTCKFYLLEMDLCIKILAALKTKKAYYLLCNWTRLMSDPCTIFLFFRCSVHWSCNVLLSYIKSCDHVSSFHSTNVQVYATTMKLMWGEIVGATSAMVGRICPFPLVVIGLRYLKM